MGARPERHALSEHPEPPFAPNETRLLHAQQCRRCGIWLKVNAVVAMDGGDDLSPSEPASAGRLQYRDYHVAGGWEPLGPVRVDLNDCGLDEGARCAGAFFHLLQMDQ
jgi:hypothetical protein